MPPQVQPNHPVERPGPSVQMPFDYSLLSGTISHSEAAFSITDVTSQVNERDMVLDLKEGQVSFK